MQVVSPAVLPRPEVVTGAVVRQRLGRHPDLAVEAMRPPPLERRLEGPGDALHGRRTVSAFINRDGFHMSEPLGVIENRDVSAMGDHCGDFGIARGC